MVPITYHFTKEQTGLTDALENCKKGNYNYKQKSVLQNKLKESLR